jgi:hypothetical protein
MVVTVLTWSYLARSMRISILHLVKLEALRLSVTDTWVRTLAMFTAEEDKAGRVPAEEEPSAGWVETERALLLGDGARKEAAGVEQYVLVRGD